MSNLTVNNLTTSGNITTTGTVSCSDLNVTGTINYENVVAQTSVPVGTVLEDLFFLSDGTNLVTQKGTITKPDNSAYATGAGTSYQFGTTWADIPGSEFSYQPPDGTKKVRLEWTALFREESGNDRGSIIPFLDGVAITKQQQYIGMHSGTVSCHHLTHFLHVDIVGSGAVTANGELDTWNEAKQIRWQGMDMTASSNLAMYRGVYGAQYPNNVSSANYFGQYSYWRLTATT